MSEDVKYRIRESEYDAMVAKIERLTSEKDAAEMFCLDSDHFKEAVRKRTEPLQAQVERLTEAMARARAVMVATEKERVKLNTENPQLKLQIERLTEALEMLYDKYENGDPCTEYGDEDGSYMGNAVKLSSEEDDQVLGALESAGIKTALSFTVDGTRKANAALKQPKEGQ